MEMIQSFSVDHTKIVPGIFVSRVDEVGGGTVTTYDIRMKRPNIEPAVDVAAMHTLEHIIATAMRNDPEWKDEIVYWGPMGCLTGFYLIVKGRPAPSDLLPLLLAAFDHCAAYEGEVPGATPAGCGNYLLHDLPMAKYESKRFADLLRVSPCFEYPKAERVTVDGRTFFDS